MTTPRSRVRRFIVAVVVLDLLAVMGAYAASVWVRGVPTLEYLQNPDRRTQSAGLFRADPMLGYVPVPGASGAFLFPGGGVVPIKFDAQGFRVPVAAADRSADRPAVLTLGCSYAFGDAVPAEETFTWRLGDRLGGPAINAGVSGYGLAQMLVLAERLVPVYRPRILLVEYAGWLVERALSETAPSAFGDIPTPYFTDANGEWRVAPPVFETAVFSAPFFAFSDRSGAAPPGRRTFFTRAAMPYFAWTDAHRLGVTVRKWRGRVPPPSGDRLGAIRHAYRRLAEIAAAASASMVVVALAGSPASPTPEIIAALTASPGTTVVDAEAYLARQPDGTAAMSPQAYRERYAVWAGTPPKMVDPHPNALANALIADAILASIDASRLTPHE